MFGVYTHFSDQVKADQYHITKDLVKKIDLVEQMSVGKIEENKLNQVYQNSRNRHIIPKINKKNRINSKFY